MKTSNTVWVNTVTSEKTSTGAHAKIRQNKHPNYGGLVLSWNLQDEQFIGTVASEQ